MNRLARSGRAVAAVAVLLSASSCALFADESATRSATIDTVPTTTEPEPTSDPVAEVPTTVAPTPQVAPQPTRPPTTIVGGIPGKETSVVMNFNDDYQIGAPGAEICDAAWAVTIDGIELSLLSAGQGAELYAAAFEKALASNVALAAISDGELQLNSAAAVEFYSAVLETARSGAPVETIRAEMSKWATVEPYNAGTFLFAVEDACPLIVQGAVAPTQIFQA